jgi:hypothetical protein
MRSAPRALYSIVDRFATALRTDRAVQWCAARHVLVVVSPARGLVHQADQNLNHH